MTQQRLIIDIDSQHGLEKLFDVAFVALGPFGVIERLSYTPPIDMDAEPDYSAPKDQPFPWAGIAILVGVAVFGFIVGKLV
jgi:hypothetical protein